MIPGNPTAHPGGFSVCESMKKPCLTHLNMVTLTHINLREGIMMGIFSLGQTVMTRGVADAIANDVEFAAFVLASMERYQACDWGEMEESDKKLNDSAVAKGDDRILAAYKKQDGKAWKIYIITEWDRSYTTILFPSEY